MMLDGTDLKYFFFFFSRKKVLRTTQIAHTQNLFIACSRFWSDFCGKKSPLPFIFFRKESKYLEITPDESEKRKNITKFANKLNKLKMKS